MPLLFAVLLSLSSPPDSLGVLEGSLADQGGRPLEFATVVVLGTRRGAIADSTGSFRVDRIPPGRWIIRYALLGFPAVQDTIEFAAGRTVRRTHVLRQDLPPMKPVCPCANHPVPI